MDTELLSRSGGKCELCFSGNTLSEKIVYPKNGDTAEDCIAICDACKEHLENPDEEDNTYWRCLNDSMWSSVPAVKVMVYRVLNHISEKETWAQDMLSSLYMEEATLEWAESTGTAGGQYQDTNGNVLLEGDTVSLIKDLNVKGANFTAKRGTAVRRIRLVPGNTGQIEGKVNGQMIVILTEFVKKQL